MGEPPHSLKYKRNQYIVDQYIAEEDHGERDEEREKFFLGAMSVILKRPGIAHFAKRMPSMPKIATDLKQT